MGKEPVNLFNLTNFICSKYNKHVQQKNISLECHIPVNMKLITYKDYIHSLLEKCITTAVHSSISDCSIAIGFLLKMGNFELSIMNKLEPAYKKNNAKLTNEAMVKINTFNANCDVIDDNISVSTEFISNKYLMIIISWPLVC